MKTVVEKVVQKLIEEHSEYEVYSCHIRVNPSTRKVVFSFDSKSNSDRIVEEANAWSKSNFDTYSEQGNDEHAAFFSPVERNVEYGDFELKDFHAQRLDSIHPSSSWTDARNWSELEDGLVESGQSAFFAMAQKLRLLPGFQMMLNSREDDDPIVLQAGQ